MVHDVGLVNRYPFFKTIILIVNENLTIIHFNATSGCAILLRNDHACVFGKLTVFNDTIHKVDLEVTDWKIEIRLFIGAQAGGDHYRSNGGEEESGY